MEEHFYCFQVVGGDSSIKRMFASVYLVGSKRQEQSLRICICDDLPHVVAACNEEQKKIPDSELLQTDLSVSVNHERTLTVVASEIRTSDEDLCTISPNHEVVIPPETIWAAGAAVVVDFKIQMLKANENASVQISIMSQDDGGNEIPLNVTPRAHLIWQQKNIAGVTKLREAWEGSSDGSEIAQRKSWATRQGPQPYMSSYMKFGGHKSVTMQRHRAQTSYSKVETVAPKKKMTKMQEIEAQLEVEEERVKREEERAKRYEERKRIQEEQKGPAHSATSSQSSDKNWSSSSVSSYQDWNIVKDPNVTPPTVNASSESSSEPLPEWAKGLGDDFNYDDVVVV